MANEFARELRSNPTDAERKLWGFLRQMRLDGFHFCRQAPIKKYIADFVCFSRRLIIEVDGSQHLEPKGLRADAVRDAFFRAEGFTILRFTNRDVLMNLQGVAASILDALGPETPTPTPPHKGEGPFAD